MTKQRQVAIAIRYPGSVISVNHYKYRGRFTKPEARDWMNELGWMVKPYHLEEWKLPLEVICSGIFKDLTRQPDLSNLSKVILDAIEETTGINDRDMRWRDGDAIINPNSEPTLQITIREAE